MAKRSRSPSSDRRTSPAAAHGRSAPRAVSAYWIYGYHAVEAALHNPERIVHDFLATKEAAAAFTAKYPGRAPSVVARERLDQLCGPDAVHQGLCLRVEPLTAPTIAEALTRPGPILALDQVTDPRNIGAILRSAAAFGAAALLVQDRNAPPETGSMAKAASGGLDGVPILRETNLARALSALQQAGLWVLGLDAGGVALNGENFLTHRVALVLGAEGAGLRRLTRETCDEIVSIPMPGTMESLNVSNASAVALYEITRQARFNGAA